ncbi:hypothetical protein D187_007817 [Cystobacter fuscus DSM 2262]|uniref:Uncharacterized protein n=1 Tax=Cystobacter fuscus (strain ATCC 25194 / DSM 2262 / NBRC 100088 / M29) TaxID=1242864 RepID=S9NW77_CYSF2|nr:hypothetical protein D187_007817 [Cystobacter fuscus DSM 2262]
MQDGEGHAPVSTRPIPPTPPDPPGPPAPGPSVLRPPPEPPGPARAHRKLVRFMRS